MSVASVKKRSATVSSAGTAPSARFKRRMRVSVSSQRACNASLLAGAPLNCCAAEDMKSQESRSRQKRHSVRLSASSIRSSQSMYIST